MSFATFKERSVSQKTILVEIALGKGQGKWFNDTAGLWYWQFNTFRHNASYSYLRGCFGYGSFLRSGTGHAGISEIPVHIETCTVDGESYTEKSSRIDYVNTNKSYYYDPNTTRFYIHLNNYDEPWLHTIVIGHLLGLSNRAININSIFYEPRLEQAPAISKSKDSLYFGLVSFDGGNLQFNNADRFFDNITDNYLFGQPVTILYGGDTEAYANYRTLFKGYLESPKMNYETCSMEIIDERKKLSKKIPTNKFNQTTYSDLKDSNVGKSIPLVWGAVYNVPIICTNEDKAGAGNYDFKIADVTDHTTGITKIVQIYVDGVATTWASASLTSATFELTTGNYTAGKKVTGDIQGFKVSGTMDDNSLDVIEDLLSTYQSIAYTSDNYNTTEWAAAKSSMYDVGIFVDKERELIDIIEDECGSNFATFLIHDDGRYTWRKFNSATTATRTIEKKEFLEMPEVEWDGLEFLTSCNVGYHKDWKDREYAWYNNTESETDIFNQYLKYQEKDFETVLTTNTDAYQLSGSIMDYMDKVPANIMIKTEIQNIDLEIGDTVNFNVDRVDSVWMGDVKVEIVKISKDIMNNIVSLTGREI